MQLQCFKDSGTPGSRASSSRAQAAASAKASRCTTLRPTCGPTQLKIKIPEDFRDGADVTFCRVPPHKFRACKPARARPLAVSVQPAVGAPLRSVALTAVVFAGNGVF